MISPCLKNKLNKFIFISGSKRNRNNIVNIQKMPYDYYIPTLHALPDHIHSTSCLLPSFNVNCEMTNT